MKHSANGRSDTDRIGSDGEGSGARGGVVGSATPPPTGERTNDDAVSIPHGVTMALRDEQYHATQLLLRAAQGEDIQREAQLLLRSLPTCKTVGCALPMLTRGAFCSTYCREHTLQITRNISIDRTIERVEEYILEGDRND